MDKILVQFVDYANQKSLDALLRPNPNFNAQECPFLIKLIKTWRYHY